MITYKNMSTKNVSVDTNINNYSLSELMAIIEIQELDPVEIAKKTNNHIFDSHMEL